MLQWKSIVKKIQIELVTLMEKASPAMTLASPLDDEPTRTSRIWVKKAQSGQHNEPEQANSMMLIAATCSVYLIDPNALSRFARKFFELVYSTISETSEVFEESVGSDEARQVETIEHLFEAFCAIAENGLSYLETQPILNERNALYSRMRLSQKSFDDFAKFFIATFRFEMGREFTMAHETEWSEFLRLVSKSMLKSSDSAPKEKEHTALIGASRASVSASQTPYHASPSMPTSPASPKTQTSSVMIPPSLPSLPREPKSPPSELSGVVIMNSRLVTAYEFLPRETLLEYIKSLEKTIRDNNLPLPPVPPVKESLNSSKNPEIGRAHV